MNRLRAIIYLHVLRTWRYKLSFVNSALNTALWIAIFLLGALLFVPPEQLRLTGPYIFWGVMVWNLVSNSVWYIAGWTNWMVLAMGIGEEQLLHGSRVYHLLAGRLVTILTQFVLVAPIMYYIVTSATGASFPLAVKPPYLIYGLVTATAMAVSYGLILAALSLRTGIPGTLLDITNFLLFIIGGIAVPVEKLPGSLRALALLIPYSHASEMVRYGAAGAEPYLGLEAEMIISGVLAIVMVIVSYAVFRWVEDVYVRRQGFRGIGRM